MLGTVFYFQRFSEFLQEFALAFVELGWDLHANLDKQFAVAAAIEDGHSLILDAERRSGLSSLGNFQCVFAA